LSEDSEAAPPEVAAVGDGGFAGPGGEDSVSAATGRSAVEGMSLPTWFLLSPAEAG